MAAKKNRKPSKKPHKKAAKPQRRTARTAAPHAKSGARAKKAAKPAKALKKPAAKRGTTKPKPAKLRRAPEKKKRSPPRPAKPARAAKRTPPRAKPTRPAKRPQAKAPRHVPRAPEKKKKKALAHVEKVRPEKPKAALHPAAAKPQPPPSASGKPKPPPSAPSDRRSSPSAPASKPRTSQPGKAGPPPSTSSRPGKSAPPSRPSKSAPPVRAPSRPPLREPPPRLMPLPLPILAPPKRPSIEERAAQIEGRLMAQTEDFRKRYEESLDMSWIYHDSALEGVVYTFEELRAALMPPAVQPGPAPDSSLQPTYADIRRHKEAIEFVRQCGLRKMPPVTVDIVKKIYLILHPEEGDIKTVKYRKDIPQHRLYFHEYAPPDKIAYKVRQIVDWLNDPETRKTRNGIRIAARAHYDLLRVYPFPTDSGKVARLFMNLLLMRSGLPPAIIHSTERQRYYEALKGSATTVLQMVQEAVENALSSVEKLLDEHETRKRAFVS